MIALFPRKIAQKRKRSVGGCWHSDTYYVVASKMVSLDPPLKMMQKISIGCKISNMDLTFILIGFKKGPYKKLFSHFCSEIAKSRRVLPGKLIQKVATNGPAL